MKIEDLIAALKRLPEGAEVASITRAGDQEAEVIHYGGGAEYRTFNNRATIVINLPDGEFKTHGIEMRDR